MQMRWQFAISVVLAALLGAGWFQWSSGRDGAQSKEPRRNSGRTVLVLVEPAVAVENNVVARAIGTGEARRSAMIHASVSGEVKRIDFEAGERAGKGRPLVRLDDTHQRLAVRLAAVAVKETKRQLKRLEKLASTGAASMARLETVQSEVESADLRLAQAKADLRDRTVYAPFDGILGMTEIDVGDRVNPETSIATLDDRSYIKVAFNLPEEYASRVKLGSLVTVRPWTMADRVVEGSVSQIGSRIDPLTRSLKIEAEIANADDSLRPGTSFQVRMSFAGRTYPSVREVSVLWSRDGAYLWRAADGKVEQIYVKVVRRDGGRILIDGGIEVGDQIVVEGVQGLRPGQRVKTRPFSSGKVSAKDTDKQGST